MLQEDWVSDDTPAAPPASAVTGVLVAFGSLCPQVGKSTVAQLLCANLEAARVPYLRLAFADTLKRMLDALLEGFGIDAPLRREYLYGRLKEAVIPELGVSPRKLMQNLGTDWAHPLLRPDVWVRATEAKARVALAGGVVVVIDDLRFRTELHAVARLRGLSVLVRRPGEEVLSSTHQSDVDLRDISLNRVLTNDSTVEQLVERVMSLTRYVIDARTSGGFPS